MPSVLTFLLIAVKKSPTAEVKVKNNSPRPDTAPDENILVIKFPNVDRAFLTKSTTENNPLKVLVNLSTAPSDKTRLSEIFCSHVKNPSNFKVCLPKI